MARQTLYTNDIADKVCAAVARGEPLPKAAESVGITFETIWMWDQRNHRNFRERLDRARMMRTDYWAEQIVLLSDDAVGLDMPGVQARKLQVDSRKWLLSKMRPDLYGDKVQVNHHQQAVIVYIPRNEREAPDDALVIDGSAALLEQDDSA